MRKRTYTLLLSAMILVGIFTLVPALADNNNESDSGEVKTGFLYMEEINRVKSFWDDMGSRVSIMDPETHDLIFAAISHLPHAVAFVLVDALIDIEDETGIKVLKYTGGGFRDFTRIAESSPQMWQEIFLENKKQLLFAIDKFIGSAEKLKNAIKNNDSEGILKILKESRDKKISIG